jgi:dephospho-CoA kinase
MRVGVAGFMGAGKSTVARLIAQQCACPYIDADAEAKRLMDGNAAIRDAIAREFGAETVVDGRISFPILGPMAFSSPKSLDRLNRIVHPPLLAHLGARLQACGPEGAVLDAALITLWCVEKWFDLVVWVDAPADTRCARVVARTGLSAPEVRERMARQEALVPQPADSRWRRVVNNGTVEELQREVADTIGAMSFVFPFEFTPE